MLKKLGIASCLTLILIILLASGTMAEQVRPCSGAGFWFPASEKALHKAIEDYLAQAPKKELPGQVIALVSSHAGYTYCGSVMGTAYNTVKDKTYDRVIILAISHGYPIPGASVLNVDAYETPLGKIPVDKKVCEALLKSKYVTTVEGAHRREHSDENQLPFLQVALKDGFKLVSILVGDLTPEQSEEVAKVIKPFINDKTLLVASSDLTHYGYRFDYVPFTKNVKENLYELDGRALNYIAAKDVAGFSKFLRETNATICGRNDILLLLRLLPQQAKGEILKYMTSGDLEGDYSTSVGYGAIAFYIPEKKEEKPAAKVQKLPETPKKESEKMKAEKLESEQFLTKEEQKTLLTLARDTLTTIVKTRQKASFDAKLYKITPQLKEKMGVFVTLNKNHRLRGCIGYIEGIKPIYEAVIDNTWSAAFNDPRFPPVTVDELQHITIEISVMTPLKPIKSIEEIKVGKHGLVIKKGWHQGILLPQVPVEWGWDRDEFLLHICRKAGLPDDAWQAPDTVLQTFSAQVFGEKNFK